MKKEWIKLTTRETAIKVRNTKVEAIRSKNLVKKGVRVFENGYIGISGCIGDTPNALLEKQAEDNLAVQIEYPYTLETGTVDHRDYNENPMDAETLLKHTNQILEVLRTDYPAFDFSETVSLKETEYQFQNTEGVDLLYKDAYYSIGLLLKDKQSANLFDGFLMNAGRQFNPEKFWKSSKDVLKAYETPVALPENTKLPVIFLGDSSITGFLNRCLNGESYALGSSLFSGKIGEKLFDERVNVSQYRNPKEVFEPFFDKEGVVLENNQYTLIENGVLKAVYTDKRTASKFNLPHTGAASGSYDSMPTLENTTLKISTDASDLKTALGGQPAILIVINSGGDFTPDGDYASPVQASFLYDGENLLGKLPEFNIRGNLFDLLGKDYVGTFDNQYFYTGDSEDQVFVFNMEISR